MRRVLLLAAILLPAVATAHDLWLEADGDAIVLHQGHRHSAHAGAETVAYDAARVVGARCLGRDGKLRALAVPAVSPVRLAGGCAVLQADYVSGYWTKTAWETKNVPKTGIAGVLRSWHSAEAVKRVGRWVPAAARPLGQGLEITPLRDPLTLVSGDRLSLLVTDNGKPVAGLPVSDGGDVGGVSGSDGRIAIRLARPGVQLITTTLATPLNDGKADRSLRSATLQFEIAR